MILAIVLIAIGYMLFVLAVCALVHGAEMQKHAWERLSRYL